MSSLRVQQEETQSKYEELQAKVKTLEQENLAKEQEITSLSHKNQLLETEVDKLETGIKEAKTSLEESGQHGTQNESLQRRLQLLEEEAEETDKNIRETNEKYDLGFMLYCYRGRDHEADTLFFCRLRQTDVKAGHYERKVQALEASRDQWEEKYEDMAKKYTTVKKELDDFQIEIGNI